MCVCVWGGLGAYSACRGKRSALDPLGVELQGVANCPMWVLWLKPRSSAKAAGALNHWTLPTVPGLFFFYFKLCIVWCGACVWVWCLRMPEEDVRSPGAGVKVLWAIKCSSWELNLGLLQEQPVILNLFNLYFNLIREEKNHGVRSNLQERCYRALRRN